MLRVGDKRSAMFQAVLSSLRDRGHVTTSRGPTAGFAAMVAAMRDAGDFFVPQTDKRRIGSVDGF